MASGVRTFLFGVRFPPLSLPLLFSLPNHPFLLPSFCNPLLGILPRKYFEIIACCRWALAHSDILKWFENVFLRHNVNYRLGWWTFSRAPLPSEVFTGVSLPALSHDYTPDHSIFRAMQIQPHMLRAARMFYLAIKWVAGETERRTHAPWRVITVVSHNRVMCVRGTVHTHQCTWYINLCVLLLCAAYIQCIRLFLATEENVR